MVFETIKQMLVDELGVDESEVTMESNMIEDLNADSLDLLQMLTLLERNMGLHFTDEEIKSVKTVKDVVDVIESKKKN